MNHSAYLKTPLPDLVLLLISQLLSPFQDLGTSLRRPNRRDLDHPIGQLWLPKGEVGRAYSAVWSGESLSGGREFHSVRSTNSSGMNDFSPYYSSARARQQVPGSLPEYKGAWA
jgi:hypothetical protein